MVLSIYISYSVPRGVRYIDKPYRLSLEHHHLVSQPSLTALLCTLTELTSLTRFTSLTIFTMFTLSITLTVFIRFTIFTITSHIKKKNDRRNSGGTPRQKFNLIEIWHFIFYILHRPRDPWTNGPIDQWTNRQETLATLWKEKHIGTLDYWNIGTLEHLNLWIFEQSHSILFKWLRVTLVTSIASMDWVKIWKSCTCSRTTSL